MKKYCALMIDLKKSRSYSTKIRNSIQNSMMEIINILNEIFENSLEKKVDFSAGDEIQGLFISSIAAYLYYRFFSMLIFPFEIRAGIGLGTWDVVIEGASTTAQDGIVYHNARKAINDARKSLEYSVLFYSMQKKDSIINSLINTVVLINSKQSAYQNDLMLLTEILYPITMNNVVDSIKIKKLLKILEEKNELNLQKLKEEEIFSNPIEIVKEDIEYFITAGKKRGLSTQLSEYLGISRQSIEKTIKTANIFELRNLVISILFTMED
ncbi:SatD family protein [Fusobacterium russii]|uniref:SatD family protein n=1 Tax=Fusobacterium russii TaxID=854 RepID=UPI0003A7F52C|nr:SatD family protein [Fusobacterium russii]